MVTLELTTGSTQRHILVAFDNETAWAVGVRDGESRGETVQTLIRKENIVSIRPAKSRLVGGVRYFWANERHRTAEPEQYSNTADRMLSLLRDR